MESIELGVEDLERRYGIILPEGPPQDQDQDPEGSGQGKRKRSKEEKERRKSEKAERAEKKRKKDNAEGQPTEESGEKKKKSKKDKKAEKAKRKEKESSPVPVEETNDIDIEADPTPDTSVPALTLAEAIDNSARLAEEEEERKRKKHEKKEKKRLAKGKERAVEAEVSEQEQEPASDVQQAEAHTPPQTPAPRSTGPTQYGTGKNKKRPLSIAPSSPAVDRSASPAVPAATQMVSIDAAMVEAALASASSSADAAVEPTAKRAKTTKAKAVKDKSKGKEKEKQKDVEPKESDAQLRERLKAEGALDQWLATANIGKTELGRLEKAGIISYTKGKFTETEKIAIRKALEKYEKVHRMSQEEIVELVMLKVQDAPDKEAVREFWRDIASVLPGRPILNIQPFVRRLVNPYAHKGRWTSAEDALLSRAYTQHPREWKKISALVERTEQDCRDRYLKELEGGEGRVSGRWTAEEVERLERAVRKVVKGLKSLKAGLAGAPAQEEEEEEDLVDLMEDVDIPWDLVAKEMGTRSITQCRIKWRDSCSPLMKEGGLDKGDADVRTLAVINRLRELDFPSEKHIEWYRVHEASSLLHLTQKDVRNAYTNLKHRIIKANKEGDDFKETLETMKTLVEKKVQRKQKSGALKEFRSDSVIDESGDEAE
ncbi:hypothetical protein IAR50_003118 [Cryptococcus sp. DSM 104548]